MKKIIVASALIVGLAAGVAYSHGNGNRGMGYGNNMMGSGYGMMGGGSGGMMGPGMMGGYGNCPGAAQFGQGWNSETQQKFLEDTVGLRKEMNDKRFEYMEAQRKPGTTMEQLSALEKEIIDIRTKLQEKAEQYR